MQQADTSAQFQPEDEGKSARKAWNRPQISRLPVLDTQTGTLFYIEGGGLGPIS